jgi:GNAT superfamily N-acetyltransferase
MEIIKVTGTAEKALTKEFLKNHLMEANIIATMFETNSPTTNFYIFKNDKVVGIAMYETNGFLVLSDLPPGFATEFAKLLINEKITGIRASKEIANEFLNEYKVNVVDTYSLLTYVLKKDEFTPMISTGSSFVVKDPISDDLVEAVMKMQLAFHEELGLNMPKTLTPQITRERISSGELQVWMDDINGQVLPVSMACARPLTFGDMFRISLVFTPKQYRSRGYALSATSAAVKWCFDKGCDHCLLYADESKPKPNLMYQSLGFRASMDKVEMRTLENK